MSLVIFIAVLSVLIVVHEWGHYIAARRLGVRVERFSVGFGKKLWSRKRGDTEFMVCAIPLGGYVKMAGEDRSQCKGNSDEFFAKPVWQRAIVVLMGPVTNFVFAFVCFYAIYVTGFPMIQPIVGKVMEGYPAQMAGLQGGDRILSVNGKTIRAWEEMQDLVLRSSGDEMRFAIRRGGQDLVEVIRPQKKKIKNIFGKTETVRLIGIQPAEQFIFIRFGPVVSLSKSFGEIYKITTMTLRALYYVVTGAMPAKDVLSGPIGIFDAVKDAAAMGLTYLLMIMAVISTSLAIFNLFPVPVLDGGHLFFFAIESLRRRPLSPRLEEGLTRAGLSLLICLMIFVFYNDMIRVGWVEKISGWFEQLRPNR